MWAAGDSSSSSESANGRVGDGDVEELEANGCTYLRMGFASNKHLSLLSNERGRLHRW